MSLDLTPEQRKLGKDNFAQAAADLERQKQAAEAKEGKDAPTRRTFMKVAAAAGAVVPLSAAVYFGYDAWKGNKAVKVALIGTGDEGCVLVGEHNPEYTEIVAVCDVRPWNLDRVFKESGGPRKGLNKMYGEETAKKVKKYLSVEALLADKDKLGLEGVIIATPLVTHHTIAMQCMDAGLHVLCEKLMARRIRYCKDMIAKGVEKGLLLSVGHQRHYSMLYAHAREVVDSGVLGDLKHIRALWHRNNSWPKTFTAKEKAEFDKTFDLPMYGDTWYPPVRKMDTARYEPDELKKLALLPDGEAYQLADKAKALGYTDVEQLVRWRTYNATGGGLMAELGSHQLDAASIFLGKVHPLRVVGTGVRSFYSKEHTTDKDGFKVSRNPRECEDGVFVTFEFPGKNYAKDANDKVVVTYSSFSTNGFEQYGEHLMGSRGNLVIEKEASAFLFREMEPGSKAGAKETTVTVSGGDGKKPALEAASTWGGGGGAAINKGPAAPEWDTDIRGYRTEMEHFAFLIRRQQKEKLPGSELYKKSADGKYANADALPRCHGEVALADAIIALTANMAMAKGQPIDFEHDWFDAAKLDAVPETKHEKQG